MAEKKPSMLALRKDNEQLRKENSELRVNNDDLHRETMELKKTNDELYGKVLQLQAWVKMLQQELEETRAERDSHGIGY